MAQPNAEYEYYKRIKVLGEGSFGKAYLVECVSDGSLCVIKQVDLSKMNDQEKKDTLNEAKILEAFNHPNIIKFREVYKTKKGKLCIVMDYADGGDLAAKIKEAKGVNFPENLILDWFTQICLAMKHVHDRKILHRDLKCQNIFLTKTNMIKLGDFGIARVLSSTRDNARTMVGTPYYLSPEIINGRPYSFKSDIWSLGVVLYELCALKPPFDANSLTFLAMKIVKGQYSPIPNQYSKELKNLVATLLQVDPSKRPSCNTILQYPIIQARVHNFLSESMRIKEFSHTVLHKQNFVRNDLKFENIKSVNNETPIPQHLLNKQEQQKPPLPSNKPQNQAVGDKQPLSSPMANDKPPVQNNNQQKPNYHYKNISNQPNPGQPNPIQRPADPIKEKQVYQPIMARYNNAPNLVKANSESKEAPEEKRLYLRHPSSEDYTSYKNSPQNQEKLQQQQQPNLNPSKWVNKPISEPPKVNPVPKKVEREIIGGGGGGVILGGFGGFNNPAPKKVEHKPAPKKVSPTISNNPAPKKDDAEKKALEKKKYEEEKLKREKQAEEEKKRKQQLEEQRLQREKEREEQRKKMLDDIRQKRENAKKQQAGNFKVEVYGYGVINSNEEEAAPMEFDKGEDVPEPKNTEIPSPEEKKKRLFEKKATKDLTKKEETKESKESKDSKESKESKEATLPKEEKKGGREGFRKFLESQQHKRHHQDDFTVEVYVPTREPPKRYFSELPKEEKKEEATDTGEDNDDMPTTVSVGEIEDKPDPFDDNDQALLEGEDDDFQKEVLEENKSQLLPQIEKIIQKIDNNEKVDEKENKDLQAYEAFIEELAHIVENPPTDNSEGDAPVVNNKPLSSEEDRDDDIEDSVENNQVKDSMTFMEDKIKTDVSIEYMSDYSKLEVKKAL